MCHISALHLCTHLLKTFISVNAPVLTFCICVGFVYFNDLETTCLKKKKKVLYTEIRRFKKKKEVRLILTGERIKKGGKKVMSHCQ